MAKPRIEKPARTLQCKNPECGREFTTKKYGRKDKNQVYCSRKCCQQHWFLRRLAKERTVAMTRCPNCKHEYPVTVRPEEERTRQPHPIRDGSTAQKPGVIPVGKVHLSQHRVVQTVEE